MAVYLEETLEVLDCEERNVPLEYVVIISSLLSFGDSWQKKTAHVGSPDGTRAYSESSWWLCAGSTARQWNCYYFPRDAANGTLRVP